jgi:hypothetical protein
MSSDFPDALMNLARDPERLLYDTVYVSGGYAGNVPANTTADFTWIFANDGKKYVVDTIMFDFDCRGPIDTWVDYYPDSAQPTYYDISDKITEFSAVHHVSKRNIAVFGYPGKIISHVANSNAFQRWVACVFNWYTFIMP